MGYNSICNDRMGPTLNVQEGELGGMQELKKIVIVFKSGCDSLPLDIPMIKHYLSTLPIIAVGCPS